MPMSAAQFTTLKTRADKEWARRCHTGSLKSYSGLAYTPTTPTSVTSSSLMVTSKASSVPAGSPVRIPVTSIPNPRKTGRFRRQLSAMTKVTKSDKDFSVISKQEVPMRFLFFCLYTYILSINFPGISCKLSVCGLY